MLEQLITQRRETILGRWLDRVTGEYAPETAKFLKEQSDQFANPVGAALRDELATLLDGLIAGTDGDQLAPALDRIIRIRAVQEFAPSAALKFVFAIKNLIRDEVGGTGESVPDHELIRFDERVDHLALAAFDVYSRCREQIYSIRVNEIRNRSMNRIERLNQWRAKRGDRADPAEADPAAEADPSQEVSGENRAPNDQSDTREVMTQ